MKKYIFYSLIFLSSSIFSSQQKSHLVQITEDQKNNSIILDVLFNNSSSLLNATSYVVAGAVFSGTKKGYESLVNKYMPINGYVPKKTSLNDFIEDSLMLSASSSVLPLVSDLAERIIKPNWENTDSLTRKIKTSALLIVTHLAYQTLTK